MIADAPPAFECIVVSVYDGDGPIHCANGVKIRVAGIQAPDFERAEPCRRRKAGYVCSNLEAALAQQRVSRLVMGKTLACHQVGTSYARIVARCTLPDRSDLACSIVTLGAAEWWPGYVRRYHLRRCG